MKKKIFKIAKLVVLLMSTQTIMAQTRNVAWVHGLDGNSTSWQHYNQIFGAERNINSLRTSYNTSSGVTNAANQVINSVNNTFGSNANNPRNLGIGHSMGGLMIREADKLTTANNKKFGGYITVASPNYGAPIANSLLDGSVQSAATNAVNKLGDGPLSQLFLLPWLIIDNFTTFDLGNSLVSNNMVQNLIGNPTTNNDLKIGSATINSLQTHTDNSSIPRISIWAQESSPVHWRMFSTAKYGNDQTLVNKANNARDVYHGFFVGNTSTAAALTLAAILQPALLIPAGICAFRAIQWKKGRDWIDDSENIWSSLIKTSRIESQPYLALVWVECSNPPTTDRVPDVNCGHWEYVTRYRNVSVNYPSDGLLPQYTQELQGISSQNKYYVPGANHLEVRNMSNSTLNGQPNDATKARFNEIFNRSDWFNTPRR